MRDLSNDPAVFRKATVVLLTIAISAVFVGMIRGFLMALLLAAIFAGLSQPLYRLLLRWFRDRRRLAAMATLAVIVLVVVLPLLGLLGIVAAQAYQLSEEIVPWVKKLVDNPQSITLHLPEWVPYRHDVEVSGAQIASKLGELAGEIGGFLVGSLAAATQGTAAFFLNLFVMLYAMFFFVRDGAVIRDKTLQYLPLPAATKHRLLERGLSVTRATIKGTLVIGIVQGFLGGLAFAVMGIHGAAFWGAVMAVLSAIPGVGAALVWMPAAVYLLVTGQTWPGLLLLAWGGLVIGSVDNVLRPSLVGRDTKMPDLLILVSTLGGLGMFGAVGLVVGPIIAALFVTMWDVFGATFSDAFATEEGAT